MLYSNTLTESHVNDLKEIVSLIRAQPRLLKVVKHRLNEYVEELDLLDDFDGNKITRMFADRRMPERADLRAMLYDFFTIKAVDFLRRIGSDDAAVRDILKKIKLLKMEFRKHAGRSENPFLGLSQDIDETDLSITVPDEFLKYFIGYRMSSVNGDIVRFAFRISKQGRRSSKIGPFVSYRNYYQRSFSSWKVDGHGVYNKNRTLYLFGHARNLKTDESLGYRMQALQRIADSNLIAGPLISMDPTGPLAARILLVPVEDHKLSPELEKLKKEKFNAFVEHMISQDYAQRKTKYLSEITEHLKVVFPDDPLGELYYQISNFTTTTVRGVQGPGNKLARNEVALRELANENHWSNEVHSNRIADALMDLLLRARS